MDAHSCSLTLSAPSNLIGADQSEWDEAASRLDALLRAYRVKSYEHRASILLNVLNKAREINYPGGPAPVELVVAIFLSTLGFQLAAALDEKDFARARLELWVAGAESEIPQFFSAGVRRDSLIPAKRIAIGPQLELTAMEPKKIQLGTVTSIARSTFQELERRPVFRGFIFWLFLMLFLVAIFWITR